VIYMRTHAATCLFVAIAIPLIGLAVLVQPLHAQEELESWAWSQTGLVGSLATGQFENIGESRGTKLGLSAILQALTDSGCAQMTTVEQRESGYELRYSGAITNYLTDGGRNFDILFRRGRSEYQYLFLILPELGCDSPAASLLRVNFYRLVMPRSLGREVVSDPLPEAFGGAVLTYGMTTLAQMTRPIMNYLDARVENGLPTRELSDRVNKLNGEGFEVLSCSYESSAVNANIRFWRGPSPVGTAIHFPTTSGLVPSSPLFSPLAGPQTCPRTIAEARAIEARAVDAIPRPPLP
jgi:hypothetical protein